MTTTRYQAVAKELAEALESAKRDDGSTYYRLKDDCPSWVDSNLMRSFHEAVDNRLPDDWVYEQIATLADSIADYEDAENARERIGEMADSGVDIYNSDLTKWLAMHNGNAGLCDEACEELGDPGDTIKRIQYGQYAAIERIASAMIQAIEDEAETSEDEDNL